MQRSFRIVFTYWIMSLMLGLIILSLLPDDLLGAQPVLRLSNYHGPTALDIIGITLVVIATVYYLWRIWRFRKTMGLWDRILIGIWATTSIIAVAAACFNLDQLLAVSIVLGISSLLILGVCIIMKKD